MSTVDNTSSLFKHSEVINIAKMLFCVLIWGASFVAGKQLALYATPISIGFFRYLIALFLLLIIVLPKRRETFFKISKKEMFMLFCLGFTGLFAYNILFFWGMEYVTASKASIITALGPIITAIGAAVLFKEKIYPFQYVGIGIGVFGAIVVLSEGNLLLIIDNFTFGEFLVLASIFSSTLYSLLIGRPVLANIPTDIAVTWAVFFGLVLFFPFAIHNGAFNEAKTFPWQAWAWIAFLAVLATVLVYIWYYHSIMLIGATRTNEYMNLVPIAGVCFAYFGLGESVHSSLYTGGVIILIGMYIASRKKKKVSIIKA